MKSPQNPTKDGNQLPGWGTKLLPGAPELRENEAPLFETSPRGSPHLAVDS